MQLGYIMGTDSTGRKYILSFEYAKRPASVTLYYTDQLPNANGSQPVLAPDGHLITAGGINLGGTYFTPSKDVWLFPVGQPAATEAAKGGSYWTWILLAVLLLGAVGTTVWLYWRKRRNKAAALVASPTEDTTTETSDERSNNELMESICRLMEEKSLYLDSDLKMSDLAAALGVHQNIISSCINSTGRSYSQFVNDYRIEYAKRLLQEDPDKKIATIYYESGFASEQTFFRAFKDRAGMTPSEWRTSQK
jgi:AraC-like DNA-binding protein